MLLHSRSSIIVQPSEHRHTPGYITRGHRSLRHSPSSALVLSPGPRFSLFRARVPLFGLTIDVSWPSKLYGEPAPLLLVPCMVELMH